MNLYQFEGEVGDKVIGLLISAPNTSSAVAIAQEWTEVPVIEPMMFLLGVAHHSWHGVVSGYTRALETPTPPPEKEPA